MICWVGGEDNKLKLSREEILGLREINRVVHEAPSGLVIVVA
jgi:hypothetical protein